MKTSKIIYNAKKKKSISSHTDVKESASSLDRAVPRPCSARISNMVLAFGQTSFSGSLPFKI